MKILCTKNLLTYLGRGLIACLFCVATMNGYAQKCTIKTNKVKENSVTNLPSVYDFGGSTFVACRTGMVTTLSFKVAKNSTVQPKAMLFLENGIGDGVIADGTQTYADYAQDISIPGNGKTATIQLTTPFPVVEGETYTWYVQKDITAGPLVQAAGFDPENGYEGGSSWYNNMYYRTMDNMFTVRIK